MRYLTGLTFVFLLLLTQPGLSAGIDGVVDELSHECSFQESANLAKKNNKPTFPSITDIKEDQFADYDRQTQACYVHFSRCSVDKFFKDDIEWCSKAGEEGSFGAYMIANMVKFVNEDSQTRKEKLARRTYRKLVEIEPRAQHFKDFIPLFIHPYMHQRQCDAVLEVDPSHLQPDYFQEMPDAQYDDIAFKAVNYLQDYVFQKSCAEYLNECGFNDENVKSGLKYCATLSDMGSFGASHTLYRVHKNRRVTSYNRKLGLKKEYDKVVFYGERMVTQIPESSYNVINFFERMATFYEEGEHGLDINEERAKFHRDQIKNIEQSDELEEGILSQDPKDGYRILSLLYYHGEVDFRGERYKVSKNYKDAAVFGKNYFYVLAKGAELLPSLVAEKDRDSYREIVRNLIQIYEEGGYGVKKNPAKGQDYKRILENLDRL